jgi:hypothetical protein
MDLVAVAVVEIMEQVVAVLGVTQAMVGAVQMVVAVLLLILLAVAVLAVLEDNLIVERNTWVAVAVVLGYMVKVKVEEGLQTGQDRVAQFKAVVAVLAVVMEKMVAMVVVVVVLEDFMEVVEGPQGMEIVRPMALEAQSASSGVLGVPSPTMLLEVSHATLGCNLSKSSGGYWNSLCSSS